MERTGHTAESMPVVALLTLSGGFMDAYSYLGRDGVFANAQTGNMILFGVHLSTGALSDALRYLLPVLAFALGIVVAEIARNLLDRGRRFRWHQAVLLVEAAILLGVAWMPQSQNLLANSMISFACGAQVECFRTMNGGGIATTMCIGNLRAGTQALCDFGFTRDRKTLQSGLRYFGIIALFIAGAVAGHFCVSMFGLRAILGSVLCLLAAFVYMFVHREG